MQVTHMQSTDNFDKGGTILFPNLLLMYDITHKVVNLSIFYMLLFCVFIIIVADDAYYKAITCFLSVFIGR